MKFSYIHLPFLHPECMLKKWDGAMFLSPGLSNMPDGFYEPEYELTCLEAASFLRDIQFLNGKDLEIMCQSAVIDHSPADFAEMTARENFLKDITDNDCKIWQFMKKRSQQVLLWCWHAERIALEIARLEAACADSEEMLKADFRESPLLEKSTPNFGRDNHFPRWRTVCQNATFFIPVNMRIVINGPMLEELAEKFELLPVRDLLPDDETLPEDMAGIRAPLWKILGHTGPKDANAHLKKLYNTDRVWLGRM